MIVVGLTGSIGMGKSETAKMFAELDVPVFDADAVVHSLQAKGGPAIAPIAAAFPGVVKEGVLDRQKLGAMVFAKPELKEQLEAIIHPMVGVVRAAFFENAQKKGVPFVVLDVPLLFETGGNKACNKVVVVSAPVDVQRARVLDRKGMTPEKFDNILARQTPDADKRAGADYVIETDKGLDHARSEVARITQELREQAVSCES
ncbi:dephospho-CoA kinase [Kordiimonas aquimaris]|uniref:dephospho-CoA kinase n=1 Tax=Kordiimonas aquimaris TaxID=707591 RepID=UPI0021D0F13B|nr:dephospho-CoA kinase [Kordiimonas aquimaris]